MPALRQPESRKGLPFLGISINRKNKKPLFNYFLLPPPKACRVPQGEFGDEANKVRADS